MRNKSPIIKAANKLLILMIYFLFFSVKLFFQYQSVSSVDFIDDTISYEHVNVADSHVHKSEFKQDVSFAKHNRLNKRYQPQWPYEIVSFSEFQITKYETAPWNVFSDAASIKNIFLSTYLLRGPPAIA